MVVSCLVTLELTGITVSLIVRRWNGGSPFPLSSFILCFWLGQLPDGD